MQIKTYYNRGSESTEVEFERCDNPVHFVIEGAKYALTCERFEFGPKEFNNFHEITLRRVFEVKEREMTGPKNSFMDRIISNLQQRFELDMKRGKNAKTGN